MSPIHRSLFDSARRVLRDVAAPGLVALFIIQVCVGVFSAPLHSLLQLYVTRDLGQPPAFAADLRALFIGVGVVLALPGGAICDALGRKRAYMIGMLSSVVSASLFLLSDPLLMRLVALGAGLLFGLNTVAGQSYLMGAIPRKSLGLATAGFFLSSVSGNALGNALAGPIADLPGGFRLLAYIMLVALAVIYVAALFALPRQPSPETRRDLRSLGGSYARLLLRGDLWCLYILRFVPTFYWGSATLLIPLLIAKATGGVSQAAYYTSVSLIFASVCQITTGRLLDRLGTRPPVMTAITCVSLTALALGLLGHSVWLICLFGVLGAGSAWGLSTTMTSLIHDCTEQEDQARVVGLAHVAWSLGFISGTQFAGRLPEGSESLVFVVAGAACAATIGIAALHFVLRDRRRAALDSAAT